MKIPCFKLREGPPKRFLAYPAMALLLLIMGSLPVSAQSTKYFTIVPTPAYGQGELEVTLNLMPIGSPSNTYQFWIFSPGQDPRLLEGQKPFEEKLTRHGVHDIVLVVKDSNGNMVTMEHQIAVVTPAADSTGTDNDASSPGSSDGKDDGSSNFNPLAGMTPGGDDTEKTDTETEKVSAQNQKPVADFEFTFDKDDSFTVLLDGSNSTDPDGTIAKYDWQTLAERQDYENGSKDAKIVFKEAGKHEITLTVTDNDDETDFTSQTVEIKPPAPPAQPALEYNTTARVNPQIIAAGVSPSKVHLSDDQLNIVALVRPGQSPISSVTFQDRTEQLGASTMRLVGVLSNGDEFYQVNLTFPPGKTTTLKTAWGPQDGQFNIVATGKGELPSQTYPYLKIGSYSQIDNANSKKQPSALNYDTTARYGSQIIMAGFSPAFIDNNKDTQFDVIAIVRPGSAPIKHVTLKNSGQFYSEMNLAGDLSNGDKMYQFTYTFVQGALGDPQQDFVELKKLWGVPGLEGLGIEATDQGGIVSHQFPDIQFGNYPEYKP